MWGGRGGVQRLYSITQRARLGALEAWLASSHQEFVFRHLEGSTTPWSILPKYEMKCPKVSSNHARVWRGLLEKESAAMYTDLALFCSCMLS